ncbi:MAG: hypothetical protein H0Z40_08975 [Desulfotomaculum sp.]|nr:hypothetical protein [Desulfotomaculum sp.]
MSNVLNRLTVVLSGIGAAWFSFKYVNHPSQPLYHEFFLFVTSWLLLYSFIEIAFEPVSNKHEPEANKVKKKRIRRKNKTAVNAAK